MPSLVTLAETKAYMLTRLNSSGFDVLSDPYDMNAAIDMAERALQAVYDMPDTADMTAQQKEAVHEQALFEAYNAQGHDSRMALQIMGVLKAGVVMEEYFVAGIPIVPHAQTVLDDLLKTVDNAAVAQVDTFARDEEEAT